MHQTSQSARRRIAVVIGTRPEAIKLGPVVHALRAHSDHLEAVVVSTGQHREMLDQAMRLMLLEPDIDLELMEPAQSLSAFAARALERTADLFTSLSPEIVVVQGDTTTVMATSIAAFHLGIPVAHVEAGLRTDDIRNPFPEEMNRRVTSVLASRHYAPTERAKDNLLRSGIPPEKILLVGNTIVDALKSVKLDSVATAPAVQDVLRTDHRLVLMTAHRRESFGEPLRRVFRAVRRIARNHPDVEVVYPVHLNPEVQSIALAELAGAERVRLLEPVEYADLLRLMKRSTLVLTDSGGIQEEAPSFKVPVLVLRERTERPELIEAGAGRLVGTDEKEIVREASRLLDDESSRKSMIVKRNPFGDGHAAERIAADLEDWLIA